MPVRNSNIYGQLQGGRPSRLARQPSLLNKPVAVNDSSSSEDD